MTRLFPETTNTWHESDWRLSIQSHDGWYYWSAERDGEKHYGSAYSFGEAEQRADLATRGQCVNCGACEWAAQSVKGGKQ
jgi:hypothetical protein